jgi:formate hydrogenlyase transcriptional activator
MATRDHDHGLGVVSEQSSRHGGREESTHVITSAEDRYRTLLEASNALAEQPTLKAILHSFRGLLSSICSFHAGHLYILNDDQETLHLFEFDQDAEGPTIKPGTKLLRTGEVARALDEQQPVFLPDVSQAMLQQPGLAALAPQAMGRRSYLFPLSTSRKQYGILAVTKLQGEEFLPEDVAVLCSLAAHVAVALECALATDRAEQYQRELARERDRLSLLLEINNDIVNNLDINDLFRAASATIRKHFGNDFTSFMLFEERSDRLKAIVLDFPGSRGFMNDVPITPVPEEDLELLRARKPRLMSSSDTSMPAVIKQMLRAESIATLAVLPLVASSGPVGAMVLGSCKENIFKQADLDLLSQVSSQISLAIDNALAYGRLSASRDRSEDQRIYLESEISSEYNFEDIVGKSAAFQKVLEQVSIVAPTDSTVLLHGETGTGKELIARAIHNLSARNQRTFVRMNCAAIPSGLLESELFGHEKGAFTGALMQKKGRFELADGGSLFLDEIGDISLELQPKLLRAVQEEEFERLGSAKTIHVDVRIIAATHRDLPAMIRDGKFREDLFYRLNVFPVEIPPLRERRQDIPLLVTYFVSKLSRRMRKQIKSIPKQAMEALTNCPWKGNVRELANFIERAVILSQGEELNLPIAELQASYYQSGFAPPSNFRETERNVIISALKAASGHVSGKGGASEYLGLKRTTLQNKMRRLGITKNDYQSQEVHDVHAGSTHDLP